MDPSSLEVAAVDGTVSWIDISEAVLLSIAVLGYPDKSNCMERERERAFVLAHSRRHQYVMLGIPGRTLRQLVALYLQLGSEISGCQCSASICFL